MIGYYEWTSELEAGKPVKQPHFIRSGDRQRLAAAGLWAARKDLSGAWTINYVVLTRTAKDASGEIHNRMPVLLTDELRDDWLHPGALAELEGMLGRLKDASGAEAATLITYPVSRAVNNVRTAHALAANAGVSDIRAELLPGDKAAAIEEFSATRRTAMIGDGINDAPALAAADVGIAMGVTGSDAAIESASVAFTGNDLRLIPAALQHARRGRRIMTGNIVLSLGIIVALFPLALFGVLGPRRCRTGP